MDEPRAPAPLRQRADTLVLSQIMWEFEALKTWRASEYAEFRRRVHLELFGNGALGLSERARGIEAWVKRVDPVVFGRGPDDPGVGDRMRSMERKWTTVQWVGGVLVTTTIGVIIGLLFQLFPGPTDQRRVLEVLSQQVQALQADLRRGTPAPAGP